MARVPYREREAVRDELLRMARKAPLRTSALVSGEPLQLSFVETIASVPVQKKKPRNAASAIRRASVELKGMMANCWTGAEPVHLVALYAKLHEQVYGAAPFELFEGTAWYGAVSAAGKLLRDEFGGEIVKAVEFLRWVWQRERKNEQRRRAGGDDGRRIGWNLQFVRRHLVTDYRTSLARARDRGER